MMIKIDDIMNFYMNKMKDDPAAMSYKWLMILLIMLMYIQNENKEVDVAEIEKFLPNIREEMGLEE